jgi:hypothetical protein
MMKDEQRRIDSMNTQNTSGTQNTQNNSNTVPSATKVTAQIAESLFAQVTRQFEGEVCEPIILPFLPHSSLTGAR